MEVKNVVEMGDVAIAGIVLGMCFLFQIGIIAAVYAAANYGFSKAKKGNNEGG